MTGKNQRNVFRILPLLVFVFVFLPFLTVASNAYRNLMPKPASLREGTGKFMITASFDIAIEGVEGGRIFRAVNRMRQRLAGRTGIFFDSNEIEFTKKESLAGLLISYDRIGKSVLHEDESYSLEITAEAVRLKSVTDIGAIRGLETLLQLLSADYDGYYFPAVSIDDRPRFPWRGLLIDSCRHFMPLEVIKRNLDGMSAVKLNVLHWHLTEDQGFRVECKTFPKLHRLGSDGLYYTHEQIKEIIRYADDRGIRVVPEFDIPGHSTSWLVGYPHLASAPGPYSIERGYGVKDPTFDPTRKATYKFFNKFFKEMASLFPDEYIHIGGDENNGKQWNGNPAIQAFMKKKGLKDNHALQANFNKKILKILTKYNKKMIGWDEIFQPYLPKNIVIQSWRGTKSLREAARKGYMGLLSRGYYIDLSKPAAHHYLNDPLPQDTPLTDEEQKRVLGGEATMWAELVSPETVDSRIWPRTAAIAERFWSPSDVRDVEDMYRRLNIISVQLEEHGLTHIKNREMMLRRLAKGGNVEPLKVFLGVVEPLKGYARHRQGATYTIFSPLTRVVDAATPDAETARKFNMMVSSYLTTGNTVALRDMKDLLSLWRDNHPRLMVLIIRSPVLREIETLSMDLRRIATVGLEALDILAGEKNAWSGWGPRQLKLLEEAKKPRGHAELMVVDAIGRLVEEARQ
jgi:hexosaminidase